MLPSKVLFPTPFAPEDYHHLADFDIEGDAVQRLNMTTEYRKVADTQHTSSSSFPR